MEEVIYRYELRVESSGDKNDLVVFSPLEEKVLTDAQHFAEASLVDQTKGFVDLNKKGGIMLVAYQKEGETFYKPLEEAVIDLDIISKGEISRELAIKLQKQAISKPSSIKPRMFTQYGCRIVYWHPASQ